MHTIVIALKSALPGFADRSLAGQNMRAEASTSAIDLGSNQLPKSLRLRQKSKLAVYAAKFLDEKVPFRKKV